MKLDNFFKKAIFFLFSALFFTVPLFFTPYNSELFEFNKILLVYSFTVLILGFWLARMFLLKKIVFRKTPLDIPLFMFFISQVVSTIFSIDPHTSIFGYYSRFNGGLLSTTSFLCLYWALVSNSKKIDIFRYIKVSFVSALLVSFYGILEHFGHSFSCLFFEGKFDVSCWIQDVKTRVFATVGQPNWLASYLAVFIPVTSAFFLRANSIKTKIYYTLLTTSYFLCLLFTGSRSGFLGFVVSLVFFWASFVFSRLKYPSKLNSIIKPSVFFALFLLFILSLFGSPFAQINRYLQIKNWFPKNEAPVQAEAANLVVEPQLESGGTESGIIRKIVWNGALDIFKANPLKPKSGKEGTFCDFLSKRITTFSP